MPTKHSTISTTPVTYAITRYRSTAAFKASPSVVISLASPSVPSAVVLDLGVEPSQVGVVGAELLVLVVLGRGRASLHRPDAYREVILAGRDPGGPGREPPLDPELILDRLGPEHHGEAGEQRPLERVGPAQPVAGDRAVELPVPEPEHAPERDHHEQVPAHPAGLDQEPPHRPGTRRRGILGRRSWGSVLHVMSVALPGRYCRRPAGHR